MNTRELFEAAHTMPHDVRWDGNAYVGTGGYSSAMFAIDYQEHFEIFKSGLKNGLEQSVYICEATIKKGDGMTIGIGQCVNEIQRKSNEI
jgi:hypothetical protein